MKEIRPGDFITASVDYRTLQYEHVYDPKKQFTYPKRASIGMRMYTDSKVSNFLQSFKPEQIVDFLNAWNKGRNNRTG